MKFSDFFELKKNYLNEDVFCIKGKYVDFTRTRFYDLDNTMMNTFGTIRTPRVLTKEQKKIILLSGCLFSKSIEKPNSIVEMIRSLKVSKEMKNTRSYPTGFFKRGNVMIVGEAPSYKGTGITEDFMKPTLFATDTSFFIRVIVNRMFIEKDKDVPYFTNLLKRAIEENKVAEKDLEKDFKILKKEISLLKPRLVIMLGNKTSDFLKGRLERPCVKIAHPSSCLYTGLTIGEYMEKVSKEMKDVQDLC